MAVKTPALLAAVVALITSSASASLIGDEIQARWQFRNTFDQTQTFLVGPGIEGDPWRTFTTLDIDSSSISIDRYGGVIGQGAGTVWTFSDLDWVDTPGAIVGFSVSTNWTGWSDDFVSFGSDFVRIDSGWSDDFVSFGSDFVRIDFLNGVNFDSASDFFRLDLAVRHPGNAIPEPGAALLFAIGSIVAAAGIRRRRV
jgi:hypothetical protein